MENTQIKENRAEKLVTIIKSKPTIAITQTQEEAFRKLKNRELPEKK